jgi:hypothetical protein
VIEGVDDLSHDREVKPDGQVPENNSKVGFAFPSLFAPFDMPLRDMVVVTLLALNQYQTSSSGEPPQEAFANTPDDVASITVPAVFVQVVPEINSVALQDSSLPGGAANTMVEKVQHTNAKRREGK